MNRMRGDKRPRCDLGVLTGDPWPQPGQRLVLSPGYPSLHSQRRDTGQRQWSKEAFLLVLLD